MSTQSSRWIPGLDGLRAIAVLLVALHHFDTVRWFPGGFVGVDLFFVLSGYLVTTLLIDERERTGRLSLGRFWARRALRLLPPVVVTVSVVVLAVLALTITAPDHAPPLDPLVPTALTGLLYVGNWLPASGQPFDLALGHLWSLGIEEQFYVMWPLLVALAFASGLRRAAVGAAALALAAASALVPVIGRDDDWTRWYYGTDARLQSLLLGAVMAAWGLRRASGRLGRAAAGACGGAGVVALGWIALHVQVGDDTFYRSFGITGVALAAAGIVGAVAAGADSRAVAVLETPVLRWMGRRSYAIYLVHVPVMVALGPLRYGPVAHFAVGMAITLVLAEVSWRAVELPAHRLKARVSSAGGPAVPRVPAVPGQMANSATTGA